MPRGDEASEMPTMLPTFEFDNLTSPNDKRINVKSRYPEKVCAVFRKEIFNKNSNTHI